MTQRGKAPPPVAPLPRLTPLAADKAKRPYRGRSEVFDPSRFPNLGANPALERALFIQRRLAAGLDRAAAVAEADERFGPLVRPASAAKRQRPTRRRKAPAPGHQRKAR